MAKINGKDYKIVLKNYQLRQFGLDVGTKGPIEAMKKMSLLLQGDTFEGQEIMAKLLHYCIGGKESIEECYELMDNAKIQEEMLAAVTSFMNAKFPVPPDEKKKKVKQVAVS